AAFPPVTPSEGLRRRVAATARHEAPVARHDTRIARAGSGWPFAAPWRPAVAVTAAVFLARVSGLLLMRLDRSRSRGLPAGFPSGTGHPARQASAGYPPPGLGSQTLVPPAARPPVNGEPVRLRRRLKAAGPPRSVLSLQPALAGRTGRRAARLRRDNDASL